MAKKRTTVGSVVKSKETGKPDYIKVSNDVTLKKGQYLNLESKQSRLEQLDAAEASGKMSAELAADLRAKAEKMPDFVRFEIVMLTEA